MEVTFIQNGKNLAFSYLPMEYFEILSNAYRSNHAARHKLSNFKENGRLISYERQVELYTYFMYGGLDNTPDMVNGMLQEPENFRHDRNCISLEWKTIKLKGCPLKPRELEMIDRMAEDPDKKDEVIAMEMGKALSTYNQQKGDLFRKVGVKSRPALLALAIRQQVAAFFQPSV